MAVLMQNLDTTNIGDLETKLEQSPSGSVYIELKGRVRFSKNNGEVKGDNIIFERRIWRDMEKQDRNSLDGSPRWQRSHQAILEEREPERLFVLEDATGAVIVDPAGADRILVTHSSPISARDPAVKRALLRRGTFSAASADSQLLRFTQEVSRLPVGAPLYALGEVVRAPEGGALTLRKPTDETMPFVLSCRSEEDLTTEESRTAQWMFWGGMGLIVTGVSLVVADLQGYRLSLSFSLDNLE